MSSIETRYYLVERRYVGPERSGPAPRHTIAITTEPPRTNMSGEIRLTGWLGTTNDWAEYAHGEYATLDAAEAAAREGWETYEIEDQDEYMDDPAVVQVIGLGDHDPRDEWEAGDWLASTSLEEVGLSAESTDAEVDAKAAELVGEAEADGCWIAGGADAIAEVLRGWRDAAPVA